MNTLYREHVPSVVIRFFNLSPASTFVDVLLKVSTLRCSTITIGVVVRFNLILVSSL